MNRDSSNKGSNFQTTFYGDGSKYVKGADNFATLVRPNKVLDGEFKNGKLHGTGTVRTLNSETNLLLNDFIGTFRNGKKNGEGQCFYDNGIYEGECKKDERSGLGIMWYKCGEFYLGEWKNDMYHGVGVFVKANGNRFEGCFMNGMKHGEGTFYHCQTGQVQKGVWSEDVCKSSMMQDDEIRFQAPQPSPFPIPELKIQNPSIIIAREFNNILVTSGVIQKPN